MKKAAFIFLSVLMLMLTGCDQEEAPFVAKSYSVEEEITSVRVDVRDREIRVETGEAVSVDYFESEKEFYNISVEQGCLTVTLAENKEWKDYVGGNGSKEARTMTLYLPRELEALALATTNEDIILPAMTVTENVSLTANGGDISFDTLDVGEAAALDVKNGSITGRLLGGYDDFAISCTTKKGECNLPERKAGGEKTLTVHANNGDVNIDFE